MIMPAPGRFSITTGLPQRSASAAATTPARVSIEPPAAVGPKAAQAPSGIALVGTGLRARLRRGAEARDRGRQQAAGRGSEAVPLDHGLLPRRAPPPHCRAWSDRLMTSLYRARSSAG